MLFRAWYWPLHHYGVIHGDPHLGNYQVRPKDENNDLTLNLLDFGCIRVFPPRFIGGVVDLFHAIERGDQALAVDAFERWGFVGLSREIIDTLLIWATFLYGPLLDDRVRPIDDQGRPADYGRETAQKVHRRLKELGTVTVPVGVRLHGPRRDWTGRGVHASEGGAQLAPAVQRDDRRLHGRRTGGAAG